MTAQKNPAEMSLERAARSVPIVSGDTPAMREWAEELVARARAEGVELTGDGLLTRWSVRSCRPAWRSSSRIISVTNRTIPPDAVRGIAATQLSEDRDDRHR